MNQNVPPELNDETWKQLIDNAMRRATAATSSVIEVRTHVESWDSFARPRAVSCSDGQEWVIKGQWKTEPTHGTMVRSIQQMLITEQIVGKIGLAMEAPVAVTKLINLSPDLVRVETELAHFQPGLCHGSLRIKDVNESRLGVAHCSEPQNRERFARLAIMFGLLVGRDHQFLYNGNGKEPRIVFSHDHGHFFENGPNWTIDSFQLPRFAIPDLDIKHQCKFTLAELTAASGKLNALDEEAIAEAVGTPPAEWNFPMSDRLAIARWVAEGRNRMLQVKMQDFTG